MSSTQVVKLTTCDDLKLSINQTKAEARGLEVANIGGRTLFWEQNDSLRLRGSEVRYFKSDLGSPLSGVQAFKASQVGFKPRPRALPQVLPWEQSGVNRHSYMASTCKSEGDLGYTTPLRTRCVTPEL